MFLEVRELRGEVIQSLGNCFRLKFGCGLPTGMWAKRRWYQHFDGHSLSSSDSRFYNWFCANLDRLFGILRPIVLQTPRGHLQGHAFLYTHNDVAVPGPGMLPIVLAWLRGMVRV